MYFSGLMRDPEASDPSDGLRLMQFAAEMGLNQGKPYLRCDTKTNMPKLIEYYQKLGFSQQGGPIIYPHSGFEGVLLQADAQEILQKTTPA